MLYCCSGKEQSRGNTRLYLGVRWVFDIIRIVQWKPRDNISIIICARHCVCCGWDIVLIDCEPMAKFMPNDNQNGDSGAISRLPLLLPKHGVMVVRTSTSPVYEDGSFSAPRTYSSKCLPDVALTQKRCKYPYLVILQKCPKKRDLEFTIVNKYLSPCSVCVGAQSRLTLPACLAAAAICVVNAVSRVLFFCRCSGL
jgi:hypothetical protein